MVKTIKTRESTRDIKVLDKAGFLTNHLRQATVKSKEMISSDQEEGTNQYAINQVTARSKQMAGKIGPINPARRPLIVSPSTPS